MERKDITGMNHYIPWLVSLLLCVGYCCLGFIIGQRRVQYWRTKWIELEHDCARAEGRKPRNIDDIENPKNAEVSSER